MSKSNGITQNSQHQGNNNAHIRRPQTVQSINWMQGSTRSDEFKYGFPSSGLPSLSNKWWGSSSSDVTNTEEDDKHQLKEVAHDGSVKEKSDSLAEGLPADLEGTQLLTAVRRKRMEEGQNAFKNDHFRGHGVHKLSKKERLLLLNIFRSSIPNEMD